jgi:photosystem II stability/assembly factor-like uncharacterized protein
VRDAASLLPALCLLLAAADGCRRSPAASETAAPSIPVDAAEAGPATEPRIAAPAEAGADAGATADLPRWVVRNPFPTTKSLRAVAWTSDTDVWAVGVEGAVVRSTDGGTTWEAVAVPRAADWEAVGRADDDAIWVAGGGARLRSTDDGATWEVIAEGEPSRLASCDCSLVPFPDGAGPGRVLVDRWRRSWLATGTLERIDGRTLQRLGTIPGPPAAFAFAAEGRVVAATEEFAIGHLPPGPSGAVGLTAEHASSIRWSEDFGATWNDATTARERYVRSLVFDDAGRGLAVGGPPTVPESNGPLLATSDGGRSWTWATAWTEASGDPPERAADLCVPDERELRLSCTWDGGRTWFAGRYPGAVPGHESDPGGRAVAIRDLSRIVAVGWWGRLWRAERGRWVSGNGGFAAHLENVALAGRTAVAVGESVLVSSDAGRTWAEAVLPALGVRPARSAAVAMVDERRAWVGSDVGTVLATEDGGRLWTARSSGLPTEPLAPGEWDAAGSGIVLLHFVDAKRGLAATRRRLFRTDDGGRNWIEAPLAGAERTPTLSATLDSPAGPVVLLSDGKHLWRTADGGAALADATGSLPVPPEYFTISLLLAGNGGVGFVVNANVAYRTADAGATWEQWSVGVPERPAGGVVAADGTLELFSSIGAGCRVARDTSFDTPAVVERIPGASVARVVFDGPSRGLAVGAGGLIATLDR